MKIWSTRTMVVTAVIAVPLVAVVASPNGREELRSLLKSSIRQILEAPQVPIPAPAAPPKVRPANATTARLVSVRINIPPAKLRT